MSAASLPPPDTAAMARSQALSEVIIQAIQRAGGQISFAEFMHYALYTPGLGYYSSGERKFGAAGDFVTAPELSPLFAQCVARQCQQVLADLTDGVMLEFGAGSGALAAGVLNSLQALNCLPREYWILEVSAALRQHQQAQLQTAMPDFFPHIRWLDQLPSEPFEGIVLANEVLDAMPVHKFRLQANDVEEFYVGVDAEQRFIWRTLSASNPHLRAALAKLHPDLPHGYESEINLAATAWLRSIAELLQRGLILLIDYGFPHHVYYHPQRDGGTLMCHYRHHSHDDPLYYVGLQDITAHVDFTALADTADAVGLQVAGYTSQANFLLSCGLLTMLNQYDPSSAEYIRLAQQAKLLLLPSEMGELFSVLGLTQGWDGVLLGFERDERGRL